MTTTGEHDDLRDRMARVETKVDLVLGQLTGTHQDHEARIRALEQRVDPNASRLSALETWRARVAGVAIGAGTAGGAVSALIAHLLGA